MLPIPHPVRPLSYAELQRLSNEELIHALQAGLQEALAVLFDRLHRLIFSVAFKIVRDRGEAEEVMQVVFLEVFRAVAQFDATKGSALVWVMQYAYHRAISRRQYLNSRRFYEQENADCLECMSLESGFAPAKLTPVEVGHLLDQGLTTLKGTQRRVIELAFEGLSMDEIAHKTNESVANVRNHYYRGLRKLVSFVQNRDKVRRGSNLTG